MCRFIPFTLFLLIVFSSCSLRIEKRKYRKGHNIELSKKKQSKDYHHKNDADNSGIIDSTTAGNNDDYEFLTPDKITDTTNVDSSINDIEFTRSVEEDIIEKYGKKTPPSLERLGKFGGKISNKLKEEKKDDKLLYPEFYNNLLIIVLSILFISIALSFLAYSIALILFQIGIIWPIFHFIMSGVTFWLYTFILKTLSGKVERKKPLTLITFLMILLSLIIVFCATLLVIGGFILLATTMIIFWIVVSILGLILLSK